MPGKLASYQMLIKALIKDDTGGQSLCNDEGGGGGGGGGGER